MICVSGQNILDIEKTAQPPSEDVLYLTCTSGRKVLDVKKVKQSSLICKKSQKVDDAEIIPSILYAENITTKTHTRRTIKLNAKAKEVRESFLFY